MTSLELSRIPVEKRRRLAATVGLFAMLFVAVGAVAATGPATTALDVFVSFAFVVAAGLGLVAWGIATSVKHDLAEQRLDAAIAEAVTAAGGLSCGCGHEHDPTEMHVVDEHGLRADVCAHDGSGAACAHDCDTCVLAALRTEPVVAAARRPSPRPRPRPAESGQLRHP